MGGGTGILNEGELSIARMAGAFYFREMSSCETKAKVAGNGGSRSRMSVITCLLMLAGVGMTGVAEGERLPDKKTHNFVFLGREREVLANHPFLKIKRFEGAQVTYSWKQLERGKDAYEFDDIDADLKILKDHQMKLWIQLQDTTFMPDRQAVPVY